MTALTELEEARAWDVFEAELDATRNPRKALRAALCDVLGRIEPKGKEVATARCGKTVRVRPLVDAHRKLVLDLCRRCGADPDVACGPGWATKGNAFARGVLVGVFTDLGYLAREISEGAGIGMSVVQNCRAFRKTRPGWEAVIKEITARAE